MQDQDSLSLSVNTKSAAHKHLAYDGDISVKQDKFYFIGTILETSADAPLTYSNFSTITQHNAKSVLESLFGE